ncbi:MAG: thioredoxin family protein [Verrucomicrobiota bacterium]
MRSLSFSALCFYFSLLLAVPTVLPAAPHRELGQVAWLRNYEEALRQSRETGKPICLLFQEVPGYQGCVQYGRETLSHPLIVQALEEAFVPVAIFNNQPGYDRKILEQFGEPAWNYQVMRFLNEQGKDLIPRKDQVWTPRATAERMIQALKAASRPVPEALEWFR